MHNEKEWPGMNEADRRNYGWGNVIYNARSSLWLGHLCGHCEMWVERWWRLQCADYFVTNDNDSAMCPTLRLLLIAVHTEYPSTIAVGGLLAEWRCSTVQQWSCSQSQWRW